MFRFLPRARVRLHNERGVFREAKGEQAVNLFPRDNVRVRAGAYTGMRANTAIYGCFLILLLLAAESCCTAPAVCVYVCVIPHRSSVASLSSPLRFVTGPKKQSHCSL